MKENIIEAIFKLLSVASLPVYMVGYALYGFRVWCWNIENRSAWKGEYSYKIEETNKLAK